MRIVYINGNLFDTPFPIAHGCNMLGVMGAGIARDIKFNYPQAYKDYEKHLSSNLSGVCLGQVVSSFDVPHRITGVLKTIYNLLIQPSVGRGHRQVSYDALAEAIASLPGQEPIAMPKIGAGLGGGDWRILASIVESESAFEPVVYYL